MGLMEKQYIYLILVTVIIFVSGCVQDNIQDAGSNVNATTKSKTPATSESVKDILAKAGTIGPVRYEIVATTTTTGLVPQELSITENLEVWQKMPYMKSVFTDYRDTIIAIIHPDAYYLCNAYVEECGNFTQQRRDSALKTFEELSKEMTENTTLKVLGTETVDGKSTTVIEYSFSTLGKSTTVKTWIWNEKGIPLKMESVTETGNVVTTVNTEYKNFVFEDIPDSMFELPYEITEASG